MTAKEMFERLDYECIDTKPLCYKQDDGGYITEILFNKVFKSIHIENYETYNNEKYDTRRNKIDLEEFKAIQKQIEELGWE